MTRDAVDHGGGSRETRRDLSSPGWPNTTPVIVVRLPSIHGWPGRRSSRRPRRPSPS